MTSKKSQLITFLLCLCLGLIGMHRFYVNRSGSGLLMLILSFTGVGLFITGIWALVDLIKIAGGTFKDGWGFKIVFEEKK